ncbi:hypothetical protein ThidrDRAFT_4360 [Thiorhodococcus drewsii AZ1]|uniref:Uncharacterized protein n=1 Tax=Thiorhodococcus drewsii AZ1 TaxID=765913 RepID=G2E7U7_9GAMM|nr:hypothetical protein ThidrDRAFT_4360 [Thiorhodococcus drewsii AZ1]
MPNSAERDIGPASRIQARRIEGGGRSRRGFKQWPSQAMELGNTPEQGTSAHKKSPCPQGHGDFHFLAPWDGLEPPT